MSDVTTQKCDNESCGKLKMNDANHWLQAMALSDVGIFVGPLHGAIPDGLRKVSVKHFCGEECVLRWFAMELSRLKGK
jgi:hypothetical protein